jgi:hypothetical protein
MIPPSLIKQLDENIPRDDAAISFDFVSDMMSKHFSYVYDQIKRPYAMVLAVESILRNPNLEGDRQFDAVLRNRGLSAMESYSIEADHFFLKSQQLGGQYRPLWRLEGDAMRRWSEDRRTSYTFHEAFWMAFLGRYACARNNRVEILVHATVDDHRRKIDTDACRIDPTKRFGDLAYETVRFEFGMNGNDTLPFDSWVQELSREVITKLGR